MSHRHSDCKCYGCPEKDTAACPWRQAENQVKELLLERKVLRETFAESARQNAKVAEQTPTNTGSPKLPDNIKERIFSWNHRFSDPQIPLGKHGASGIVVDNCEMDDFIRQLRAGA